MPSITDIEGIEVGHATDLEGITGCTVFICKKGAVAAVDIRGGASGTREIDPLSPAHLVKKIDALLFSGGSAFGLNAAGGVMRWLEEKGIGFDATVAKIPIVPAGVIFDLWIGNPASRPDESMGYLACENASGKPPLEGSVGAGTGATVGKLLGIGHAMKGGAGSWSVRLPGGVVVGAFSVVNSWGDVLEPETKKILAGTRKSKTGFEFADSQRLLLEGKQIRKYSGGNTTLSVVATNVRLSKGDAMRVAAMAQDGLARTLRPVHTQLDGDLVFALSTGTREGDLNAVGAACAIAVSKSIVRGIKTAKSLGGIPSWKDLISKKKRGTRFGTAPPQKGGMKIKDFP